MTAQPGGRGTAIGSLLTVPFAIPQTEIASLLPDDLSLVQRQVYESSGHSAHPSTDRRSALADLLDVYLECLL